MSRRGNPRQGGSSSRDTTVTVAIIGAAAVIVAALIGLAGVLVQRSGNNPTSMPPSTATAQVNTPSVPVMTVTATVPAPTTLPSVITNSSPTLPSAKRPDWEVIVEPPIQKHYVGSEHEVYVTVRDLNGFPIMGETVHLQIVDGPHRGLVLEIHTNKGGQGVFRYTGNTKGTDIIHVWAGADQYDSLPTGMKAEITNEWI